MRRFRNILLVFSIATITILLMVILDKDNKSKCVFSENSNIGIKGSFMIAAIGSDGIIVATETRGNIFDKRDDKETPIAFFDGIQKEFILGNTVLANTGKGVIGNVFFSALINDFDHKLTSYPPVDVFFTVFEEFYKRNIPNELHRQIESNMMIVAGFLEEKPMICYFQKAEVGCIANVGYVESDVTIFKDKYSKDLSCDILAELAKNAITIYSEQKENWKTIGGGICVIKITKIDGPLWINKTDFKKWVTTDDLIKDYNDGKLNINLIAPFKENDLEKVFNAN